MKQLLIKLKETHYIVVDDSEIKLNDFITDGCNVWKWKDNCSLLGRKKVTHSTQPIEDINFVDEVEGKVMPKIKPLSLSEVEEAILEFESKVQRFVIGNERSVTFDENEKLKLL